jgi:colicin import membrane protein
MSSRFALSLFPGEDPLSLAPPPPGRWLGPLALALAAHGLLVAALTWGVDWKQDAEPAVFEAELWSRLPVEAAPRAVVPPAPPPAAAPAPAPEKRIEPPPPPPPPTDKADIATARKKAQAEQAERERQKAIEAERLAAEKKKEADAKKKAAEQKRQQEAEDKRLAQLREDQIRRMMGQAGASGGPQSTGQAAQASGPSAAYGSRVAARIKPNVVFTDSISGNPRAEVEVRALPDGTITGRRIVKSSGNPDWDEAVLRAIDRTGSLPRDTDGRVPSPLIIGLRPQD